MSGLLRGIVRLRTFVPRGSSVTQRTHLSTKPAKDELGLMETAFGLGVFSVAILAPSGWVLANLESYKKKQ